MILLLGGTSETREIALSLAGTGETVLVSTATDNELDVGVHENITRRVGRLDAEGMAELIRVKGVRLVVDATHPFAAEVQETARRAAETTGVRHIRFQRPASDHAADGVVYAEDHESAARAAFSYGGTVLLTTGSRTLLPYVKESARTGVPVIVRVLPHPESLEACRKAGIPDSSVITGRGPFSVGENFDVITNRGVAVLVTKDSGREGGVPEKIIAAKRASCRVVVIRRPDTQRSDVDNVQKLIEEISSASGVKSGRR
ncbi:MAG: precorrin-6A reductase [Nitrospinae bacterium]|nr:precorrin-6A reductase [Nitrospinota bacterium]